jgi:hypothetical protein
MSDEPITVPVSEHQRAVDAVVEAVQKNRGTPDVATVARRAPSLTYNSADDSVTYHSAEDVALAEQPGEPDTMDDRNLLHEFRTLIDTIQTEGARLEEHTFDPLTGAKVFTLPEGSEQRRVHQLRVQHLCETAEYQRGVYEAATAARDARDAAAARGSDSQAIAQSWTGGDPRRQALLDKAVEEAEARHIADAMIRARLGNLGE